ncbi:MAG: PDZ domain-containing protein [Acidobacteriia bacterium]|nr:PDZ domain-containing protein [Terriglobia bacterium]
MKRTPPFRMHAFHASRRRVSAAGWACLFACVLTPAIASPAGPPVTYVLDLRAPASHLVRVTMTVPQAAPRTEIQFPAWNALYQIRDFVRNVQELETRCDAQPRELTRVDLQTWRSGEETCASLEVRYAVYANEESVFSSVLNEQHSFMNFALLLFYLPRERQRAARVKFLLPENWKLAILLEEGPAPGEFSAANYDVLADSPAEAGEFQDYRYQQSGATYRVVVHADPRDYSAERLLASLQKITAAETALMRDVPFSQYTFILHFPRQGGGGMEHRNGTAISMSAAELRNHWEALEAILAHEFFHLWNVKRIRPQNLEPVDYVHGNDTRDLWFCEGVTSAYAELALVRAGLITRETFYGRLAEEIRRLQERPARHYQSVEQAGREAWLEKYPDFLRPERSISYYNKGALLAFLLDLGIRHASNNACSLDDVMRRLNDDFARRGRFFTQGDFLGVISGMAPAFTTLHQFVADYITGTRELDYETYLGYAGLRLATAATDQPGLGFLAVQSFDGPIQVEAVDPGSGAERAGLQRGDILLEMDGRSLHAPPLDQLAGIKPGRKVHFRVRRGRREFPLEFPLEAKRRISYRVEEVSDASPEQRRIRQGWLEGTTTTPTAGRP